MVWRPKRTYHEIAYYVCIGLGVRCVTPFEMLRKEGARFVLGQ